MASLRPSKAIPFLPGNTFTDPSKQKFHKSQALGLTLGGQVRVVDDTKPAIGGEATDRSLAASRSLRSASVYPAPRGLGETLPSWVAFDKVVLSFDGYFTESVPEARWERTRVRSVKILFYLEDDTLQVNEIVPNNSGIRGGTIVRRHRVPLTLGADEAAQTYFTVRDLNVGQTVSIYAKDITITGCDAFTAEFLTSIGVEVGAPLAAPADPVTVRLAAQRGYSETVARRDPHAALDTRRQFLENDRKVLRFYCVWDDTASMDGDERLLALHYYLATDAIEIREQLGSNSGRDPVPQFLKPSRLPKRFEGLAPVGDRPGTHDPEKFYSPADLRIGETISVFGRPVKIYDMDSATREWCMRNLGLTAAELAPAELPLSMQGAYVQVVREIPPPTGYGSEADSLACMYSLIPKPPRRADAAQLVANEGKQLRFSAQFLEPSRLDRDRRFVIAFYLMDDTVSVYEPPARNSGRIAGKFIQRSVCDDPNTGSPYAPTAFFVGAVIELASFRFVLTDADEYALRYMEAHPEQFPRSDVRAILAEVCRQLTEAQAVPAEVEATLGSRADAGGKISPDEFQALLAKTGVRLGAQELLTVMRAFDAGGDSRIGVRDFLFAIGLGPADGGAGAGPAAV